MQSTLIKFALAVILAAAALSACSSRPPAAAGPSLYQRLGGQAAIAKVTDELVDRSVRDPATMRSFDKVNLVRLKGKIAEQLCAATGGPCLYSGDDMRQAHAGLGISEAEFGAMVQHLVEILDEFHVGQREKDELVALLAPMKRDIVETRRVSAAQ